MTKSDAGPPPKPIRAPLIKRVWHRLTRLAIDYLSIYALVLVILAVPFLLPAKIPHDNAISMLNDIVILDGVLVGFVSVLAVENITERTKWEDRSFKTAYRDFVDRDIMHPKIVGVFDFMTIVFFLVSLFAAIGQIAYIGTDASGQAIGGNLAATADGLVLLMIQFLMRLFAKTRIELKGVENPLRPTRIS